MMVFFGTGAVFVAVTTGALPGVWPVAVVWGVVIALAIQVTGAVSGVHLNPAVTVAFCFWRHFPRSRLAGDLRDRLRLGDVRAFRPGRPRPTHRLRQV